MAAVDQIVPRRLCRRIIGNAVNIQNILLLQPWKQLFDHVDQIRRANLFALTVNLCIADIDCIRRLGQIAVQIKSLDKCLLPCARSQLYMALLHHLTLVLGNDSPAVGTFRNDSIVYAHEK